ncbi:ABC-type sulfate transport system [Vibrio ishigakensis]|uniref:ABC-type sulfate transport system n=1 Tax=Vibrio ishigakensis TaxID=1481914 RepID=A0A0B8QCC5_9VIBR|nr:ABC-type sulfate transport system [Vibrio ishigakensis]
MKKSLVSIALLCVAPTSIAAIDITDNLTLSGFGSTSWAKSDNETPLLVNHNINDESCFDCDTIFGLQLDFFYKDFKASARS